MKVVDVVMSASSAECTHCCSASVSDTLSPDSLEDEILAVDDSFLLCLVNLFFKTANPKPIPKNTEKE